jgi:hypothetical protein
MRAGRRCAPTRHICAPPVIPIQAEYDRAERAVELLAGDDSPAARRAAERLELFRQVLAEKERIRAALAEAEWRARH